MEWDRQSVEKFLGYSAEVAGEQFIFNLPFPGGVISLEIRPERNEVQVFDKRFLSTSTSREALSAYINCKKIVVVHGFTDDGGNCLVLEGNGGHVCIGPEGDYFSFFFSMYDGKSISDGPLEKPWL